MATEDRNSTPQTNSSQIVIIPQLERSVRRFDGDQGHQDLERFLEDVESAWAQRPGQTDQERAAYLWSHLGSSVRDELYCQGKKRSADEEVLIYLEERETNRPQERDGALRLRSVEAHTQYALREEEKDEKSKESLAAELIMCSFVVHQNMSFFATGISPECLRQAFKDSKIVAEFGLIIISTGKKRSADEEVLIYLEEQECNRPQKRDEALRLRSVEAHTQYALREEEKEEKSKESLAAELIMCSFIVHQNMSFFATGISPECLRQAFKDSKIAAEYGLIIISTVSEMKRGHLGNLQQTTVQVMKTAQMG
ncbi:hypothetical protein EGW08_020681 [Elysia chlorotica]|uniref:Uncharacterized protein n=1 Tax=Elysia chlorotica TaxID=188477 RepID=A0A3S0Z682_ELYCH|nr:hypothetical protein EGW08_020681 [Elysia chlorotica]